MNAEGRARRVVQTTRRPALRNPSEILAEWLIAYATASYILSTVDLPVDHSSAQRTMGPT